MIASERTFTPTHPKWTDNRGFRFLRRNGPTIFKLWPRTGKKTGFTTCGQISAQACSMCDLWRMCTSQESPKPAKWLNVLQHSVTGPTCSQCLLCPQHHPHAKLKVECYYGEPEWPEKSTSFPSRITSWEVATLADLVFLFLRKKCFMNAEVSDCLALLNAYRKSLWSENHRDEIGTFPVVHASTGGSHPTSMWTIWIPSWFQVVPKVAGLWKTSVFSCAYLDVQNISFFQGQLPNADHTNPRSPQFENCLCNAILWFCPPLVLVPKENLHIVFCILVFLCHVKSEHYSFAHPVCSHKDSVVHLQIRSNLHHLIANIPEPLSSHKAFPVFLLKQRWRAFQWSGTGRASTSCV